MKIVFFGSGLFGLPTLHKLLKSQHSVVGIVTNPQTARKETKMSQELSRAIKEQSNKQKSIELLTPEKLDDPGFISELNDLEADIFVVVAFRILPQIILDMPVKVMNLHASLLPNYRGAAPIHWAIINGETETGLTTFFVQKKVDTGDVLLQAKEPIHKSDYVATLQHRLSKKGADLVLKTLDTIEAGDDIPKKQDLKIKYPIAPKIFTHMCEIDFSKTTRQVYNFIRGVSHLGAWLMIRNKKIKLFKVSESKQNLNSYYLTDNHSYLYIKTSDGSILVEELQLEGKKVMPISEFLRGNQLFGI